MLADIQTDFVHLPPNALADVGGLVGRDVGDGSLDGLHDGGLLTSHAVLHVGQADSEGREASL